MHHPRMLIIKRSSLRHRSLLRTILSESTLASMVLSLGQRGHCLIHLHSCRTISLSQEIRMNSVSPRMMYLETRLNKKYNSQCYHNARRDYVISNISPLPLSLILLRICVLCKNNSFFSTGDVLIISVPFVMVIVFSSN